MTLYHNPWSAASECKKRRRWRRQVMITSRARSIYAYGNQWKRYPRCKAMYDLQLGYKTHTGIIPENSYIFYREQWVVE